MTKAKIQNKILQEDIECNSPDIAAYIALDRETNGWNAWRTFDGISISQLCSNQK